MMNCITILPLCLGMFAALTTALYAPEVFLGGRAVPMFRRWARPATDIERPPIYWLDLLVKNRPDITTITEASLFFHSVLIMIKEPNKSNGKLPQDFVEWLEKSENKRDLRHLIIELNQNPTKDQCGAKWLEDTLGAGEHLVGLSGWMKKSFGARYDRFPSLVEVEFKDASQILRNMITARIEKSAVVCKEHIHNFIDQYYSGQRRDEKKLLECISEVKYTKPIHPMLSFITVSISRKEFLQKVYQAEKFRDLGCNEDSVKLHEMCYRYTSEIDHFMNSYDLGGFYRMVDIEQKDKFTGEDYAFLEELNRLCQNELLTPKPWITKKLATVKGVTYYNTLEEPLDKREALTDVSYRIREMIRDDQQTRLFINRQNYKQGLVFPAWPRTSNDSEYVNRYSIADDSPPHEHQIVTPEKQTLKQRKYPKDTIVDFTSDEEGSESSSDVDEKGESSRGKKGKKDLNRGESFPKLAIKYPKDTVVDNTSGDESSEKSVEEEEEEEEKEEKEEPSGGEPSGRKKGKRIPKEWDYDTDELRELDRETSES